MGEERVRFDRVAVGDRDSLAYRERPGDGPTVILLHGHMSSSRHWDVVLERLDERYHVYALDMRGFGESSYRRPVDGIDDFAGDVADFAAAVGVDSAHLWGWSLGGAVAMTAAAGSPELVESLLLMAPPSTRGLPVYEKEAETLHPTGRRLRTRDEIAVDPIVQAQIRGDRETMRAVWRQSVFTNDVPSPERFEAYLDATFKQRNVVAVDHAMIHFNISETASLVAPGSGDAADITQPTLVVRGADDAVIDRAHVEELREDVPHARYREFENCGHAPTIDCPDELVAVAEGFFEGSQPSCSSQSSVREG